MARDLHPSLGPSPAAKPVCCGCATIDDRAVLVPLSPTVHICGACAANAWGRACGEHLRLCCEHLLDVDAWTFPPPPFAGSVQ